MAGAWTALREKNPAASVTQIENLLQTTGVPIASNGLTRSRIQVDKARDELVGPSCEKSGYVVRVCVHPAAASTHTSILENPRLVMRIPIFALPTPGLYLKRHKRSSPGQGCLSPAVRTVWSTKPLQVAKL